MSCGVLVGIAGRALVRVAIMAALTSGVVAVAAPASAHSVAGVGATNFRTTLTGLAPVVAGLQLRVVENGARLELRNDTSVPVVILGYQGEPYARVGADGVFVNDRSPATYLNTDRYSTMTVPADAVPGLPPVWRKVADGSVWRWHDHRIHWMATSLPAPVAAAPGQPHHLSSWSVSLDHNGRTLTASGALDWVPGPSPWPWLVGALVVGAALAAAAGLLRRPHPILGGAAAVMVISDITHTAGVAAATAGGLADKVDVFTVLGPSQLLIWVIGAVAALALVRSRAGAAWAAALVAIWVVLITGVSDLPVLWRSSAPTALPAQLDRASLAAVLGVGAGLIAAALILWWRRRAGLVGPSAADLRPRPGLGRRIQRREVMGYVAAGGLGAIVGATAGGALTSTAAKHQPAAPGSSDLLADVGARRIEFHGNHQAGIVTPARQQAHGWVAAFDLTVGTDLDALRALMKTWTDAAARLTAGMEVTPAQVSPVTGRGPAALTVTVGFGPSLFGKAGVPAAARPAPLTPLPAFAGEELDPARSDGDLAVVVCADDAAVVVHAARTLCRLAAGTAVLRWQMSGFDRARGAGSGESTSRNLMGQLDGTNNPKPTDPDFVAKVFVPADADPAWLRGGSYLVVRRIRMLLDDWDDVPTHAQEMLIGRRKDNGAPLSGGSEHTPPNYGIRHPDGTVAIAADAHIRLAAPAFNNGAAMLRRGFSYADGTAADGAPDAGLLFLAWQADPRHGFVPVQHRLARADALNRFIRHETSALFVMPAGTQPGDYLGQRLLSA